MIRQTLVVLMAAMLAACSTSRPNVDPQKRYVRYFSPTKEVAYSLNGPVGPWRYVMGRYRREDTSMISFSKSAGPYVEIDVTFRLHELLPRLNDEGLIEQNKFFFRNRRLSEVTPSDRTLVVGTQGFRCAKSLESYVKHYGPSRDTAISGKWAGGGNTKHEYQVQCPFHRNGRHFLMWVDTSYTVLDAADPAGVAVDIAALHAQTERQFERVWQSIFFNPELSQAPLPDDQLVQPQPAAKPRHVFPDQYTGDQPFIWPSPKK